jgi:beta-galactosidase
MNEESEYQRDNISRGKFVQYCAVGVIALASNPLRSCLTLHSTGANPKGPSSQLIPFDNDWLFGGRFIPGSLDPQFDDVSFTPITLPHCVAHLSWQDWKPESWQDVYIYRRHFDLPVELRGLRVFLHFDGVMVGAAPTLNGQQLNPHLGGYLPFNYEITELLREKGNVLAVAVDARWSNVPPQGAEMGPRRIDYLEAAGIHRSVHLKGVPQLFISDVFAKPVNVLGANRSIVVSCTIDSRKATVKPVEILVEMKEGQRVICRKREKVPIERTGSNNVSLSLTGLSDIKLWDVEHPYLYDIITTLYVDGKPLHNHYARIGLRDARFEKDGFFLNGRRLQLFGLNRHEIYPYVGFAMPDRVKRRDAAILRNEFNCNIVRCSHYPQSAAFLDACDELGLLVWEEIPGFQYLGDESWKELMLRDVKDMVMRDRNRPSIIIWGTRANESQNAPELYKKSKALAKSLDDSRPSSGSMAPWSRKNWKKEWDEDVFAYDDYHSEPDGSVALEEPIEGVPYFFAEAVGQFNYTDGKSFDSIYRRGANLDVQVKQALRHAEAHSKAGADPRICGLIAWCGFEYTSLINPYRNVKYPGVADIFRIPKLGASFYLAQKDPQKGIVLLPNFYWDFGPASPRGPGKKAAIFSNCEQLKLYIGNKLHTTVNPDFKHYPNLKYPPFFADLDFEGELTNPELRIDGYIGKKLVLSRTFSSNRQQDQFLLVADDHQLIGSGSDATRIVFRVTDKFGAPRAFAGGVVSFEVTGPGIIVGDNPFNLEESGGAGAVWLKINPKSSGRILVKAIHNLLGSKQIEITTVKPSPKKQAYS